ncbi:MAG: nuclear transport factor 2 family protein [Acidimicrobiales bacterium]
MSHSRDEVERAFAEFRQKGVEEHDWPGWADLFTDDALYIEHNLGTLNGRASIKNWIVNCMKDYQSMSLDIDWWMIEDDRVAFDIWNILPDPTGGTAEFKFPKTTVLHYAGDGKWSYEEDYYNPHDAARVFTEWLKAGGNRKTPQDRSLEGVKGFVPELSSATHSRQEVEAEYERYSERAGIAVATGNWDQWADQFTVDARYREHHFGTFQGREEIRSWIKSVMAPLPGMEFPTDWYMIDGNRVTFRSIQRLPDPSGGTDHFEWPVHVILHYAGNGQWSYEEDVYNPDEGVAAIEAWVAAGGEIPPEVLAKLAGGEGAA